MKGISLVIVLLSCLAETVKSQCYFSEDGQSMLSVEYDYYHDWDTVKATHYFHYKTWDVSDHAYELKETGRFHDSLTQPVEEDGDIPGFEFPESLRQNFPVAFDESYNLYNIDSLVSLEVDASRVRLLSRDKGWCSKGCSWTSSYRMNAHITMSIRGENVWDVHFKPIYTLTGDYIAWGKKPVRHSRLYFERFDDETMEIRVYWSARISAFFVSMVYYEKEYVPEAHPEFPQKAFLVRV